jgi:monoamine oxidase
MEFDCDAIVIGAGFAGLIAARECSHRGLSTVILEGRPRIGGRTYSTTFAGHVLEMGGTSISSSEPHLWAELTRYGLDVRDTHMELDAVCAPVSGGRKWCTPQEHHERERALVNQYFAPSTSVFPRPYDPLLMKDEIAKFDISAEERLEQLDLSADDEALLRSLFAEWLGGDLSQGGYLALLRWYALGGHDYDRMGETQGGTVIKDGTSALHQAILEDSGATLKLSTTVAAVESEGQGVRVRTQAGETLSARVCVVATTAGSWADVEFSPPLSENRMRVARERVLQAPAVSSTKVVLKGERRRIYIMPEADHPISSILTLEMLGEDLQICRVMQHPTMRNAADWTEMAAAIKDLLPEAEVLEHLTETYYGDDPLTRGGWSMYHAGVLSREEPPARLAQPEGRVVFATSDIAKFWHSFIDGAIESGITAGRLVRGIVRNGGSQSGSLDRAGAARSRTVSA